MKSKALFPILMAAALLPTSFVTGAAAAAPVIELFTSQGCYSCPPADELLGRIIRERPDVVALEFHVDYWDELVYGSAGKWKDPFSSRSYSQRQRAYNQQRLQGRPGVYTPQMIINGQHAAVGSNQRQVYRALETTRDPEVSLDISAGPDLLTLKLDGSAEQRARVFLAELIPHMETSVTAGENKDKVMHNYNVVTEWREIADWTGGSAEFRIERDQAKSTRCAIILQRPFGEIIGAGYC